VTTIAGPAGAGRPRDTAIDVAVLEAALCELARNGMAGLSLAAVASAAGTTRPAIYRRWKDKTALVVDAVAHLAEVAPPTVTGEALADLVAELEHFRQCISEASALPLAGLMLGDGVDQVVREQYAQKIVAPRRGRLKACLAAAVEQGDLPGDADFTIATSFLTGSWYAFALAETEPPANWASRTGDLVWRALGGDPAEVRSRTQSGH
jgi:AcrR family transcriptional regulator